MRLYASRTRAFMMEWLGGPKAPDTEEDEVFFMVLGRYLHDKNTLAYYFRLGRWRCTWYVLRERAEGCIVLPFRKVK